MPETEGGKLNRFERCVNIAVDRHAAQVVLIGLLWEPEGRTTIAARLTAVDEPFPDSLLADSLDGVDRRTAMVEITHAEWDRLAETSRWDDLQNLVETRATSALAGLHALRAA